jgi:hypothetical protein
MCKYVNYVVNKSLLKSLISLLINWILLDLPSKKEA